MGGEWEIEYISYDGLSEISSKCLSDLGYGNTIPIDIEAIVDIEHRFDIVPIHGLRLSYEIDGYISRDLKEIHVDLELFDKYPSRYRFTLAHEFAHFNLHKKTINAATFSSAGEWVKFKQSMPESILSKFESQAFNFAGLLLVPRDHLFREASKCITKVSQSNIVVTPHNTNAWEAIERDLSETFSVSKKVIEKRVKRDSLKMKFK